MLNILFYVAPTGPMSGGRMGLKRETLEVVMLDPCMNFRGARCAAKRAQAILADDAALGIKRCDPVLEKIAAGGARNADTWTTNQNTIRYPKIPELSFYLVVASLCKARAAFGAFGDQDMQAPIAISRVQVGSTAKHPLIKPSDFVKGLDQARKLKVIMPHPDLDKCKKTLVEFWKRWKLQ